MAVKNFRIAEKDLEEVKDRAAESERTASQQIRHYIKRGLAEDRRRRDQADQES